MPSQKIERKCLGDVTNQVSTSSVGPCRKIQLEQKVLELNDRLDALSAKFETLISNVQRQDHEISRLSTISTTSGDVVDCSSLAQTPSSAVEERSMKEQVKRSILGDEGYSIYRKTLKSSRQ
ncbi:unnamed protein product [Cylindrotheca closterium]|uniref:Uncharacterized protein n=1 Tax=Cylindrotheca closterium TaxID=2856 RepID=A0AAD2CR90_9STRA|nr:unnamed protein product [Cylindrotheca closterium]